MNLKKYHLVIIATVCFIVAFSALAFSIIIYNNNFENHTNNHFENHANNHFENHANNHTTQSTQPSLSYSPEQRFFADHPSHAHRESNEPHVVGFITDEDSQVMPLWGTKSHTRRHRWNYHTVNDANNYQSVVRLPVTYQERDCTDEFACDELYDDDVIQVQDKEYKVTLYH